MVCVQDGGASPVLGGDARRPTTDDGPPQTSPAGVRRRTVAVGGVLAVQDEEPSSRWRAADSAVLDGPPQTSPPCRLRRQRRKAIYDGQVIIIIFLDPGTQFPRNEKITLCNTKSTKIKLE